ncbi:MAG TPA: YfiR family protein [Burkholderiales bacterium]|nr:YfiR family protein [Burkholderiales bacterium]
MKRALRLLASVGLVLLTQHGALHAQVQGEVTEDSVKAAFLHRFTGFVEWPEKARTKEGYVIGVLGAEGVEAELSRYVATRKSPISVRRIHSIEDVAGVHVLFIGERENARLSKLIAAVQHLPVLIITEAPDGLDRGGMINFVTTDRVQFEVAIANAAKAGIHLNARLLSVAIRVRKGELPFPEDIIIAGRTTELGALRNWRLKPLAVSRPARQTVITAAAAG